MDGRVIYWDSSAVIPVLFEEPKTAEARVLATNPAIHLLSSLAWAEIQATLTRAVREKRVATALVHATDEVLLRGPWRRVYAIPSWGLIRTLSRTWPLRGADLWHLALAKTLKAEIPEMAFISFDENLAEAAMGEGLRRP